MPKIDLQYSHGALHADVLGPLTDRITVNAVHEGDWAVEGAVVRSAADAA